MKLRNTVLAMMALSPLFANASGLDRAGQQMDALFEDGNYAEIRFGHVAGKVTGTDFEGTDIKNVANEYNSATVNLKMQGPDNTTAFLVKYDKPWGVDTEYTNGALNGIKANVDTNSLTGVIAYKAPNNISVYGGLEFQKAEGKVNIALTPKKTVVAGAVKKFNSNPQAPFKITVADYLAAEKAAAPNQKQQAILGALKAGVDKGVAENSLAYSADLLRSTAIGYIAGIAYEVPEIALRADVTYHSATKHDLDVTEVTNVPGLAKVESDITMKFPQSVNLNFQTGIMADTLLMTKLRWVDWSEFNVATPAYKMIKKGKGAKDTTLAYYAKDQYQASIGIGRKFTEQFSGQVELGYDSGTGAPYTALGPYDDQKSISVGGKYKVNDMIDVSGGVSYLMLGDAEVSSENTNGSVTKLADFKDNDALVVGAKVGFHF